MTNKNQERIHEIRKSLESKAKNLIASTYAEGAIDRELKREMAMQLYDRIDLSKAIVNSPKEVRFKGREYKERALSDPLLEKINNALELFLKLYNQRNNFTGYTPAEKDIIGIYSDGKEKKLDGLECSAIIFARELVSGIVNRTMEEDLYKKYNALPEKDFLDIFFTNDDKINPQ